MTDFVNTNRSKSSNENKLNMYMLNKKHNLIGKKLNSNMFIKWTNM